MRFYVWRIERGKELPCGENEIKEVRETELRRERDSVGAKIRTFSQQITEM